jgi:OFA family oxalate/formate antiporter-like MFS transporter
MNAKNDAARPDAGAGRFRLTRFSWDRPDWPFDPRRVPLFYGWVIVVAATVGVLCSAPGQTIGVSVFTDDLMAATGLSRGQISLTYLVGTLTSALILPRAGRIYDRLGARTMTVGVAIAFGGTLLVLSQLDRAVDLGRALFSLASLALPVSFALMGASFFALRFLGQGVLTIATRNMTVKWFERRRGLANGVMGVMSSFGFSGAPVLFDALIDHFGWKGAWQILGLGILVGLTLIVLLFYRDDPLECGMQPDGGAHTDTPRARPATGPEHTLSEARATLPFWLILLPMMLASLYGTAFPFHVVSIFAEAGLPRDMAIRIFLPSAFIAVGVNFIGGWLSDHTSLRWHLGLFLVGIWVSSLGVLHLDRPWGWYVVAAGNGTFGGMMRLLSTVTWPRYFGRGHLGAISGFAMAWGVAGSAVGPTVFGYSLQYLDSYHPACWATIALCAVFLCLTPWAREPAAPSA